jgi:hypothetical protein
MENDKWKWEMENDPIATASGSVLSGTNHRCEAID